MNIEKKPETGPVAEVHRDLASLPAGRASAQGRTDLVLMLALQMCWSVFQLFHSPLIAHGAGYGYDGEFYGRLAQHFDFSALYRSIDSYRLQRILPSIVVGSALNAVNVHTVYATILGFRVLNVVELTAAVLGWWAMASRLDFDRVRTWLGFTLLFVNFPLMNNAFYYPVLTDLTAFTLGVWIAYAYVTNSVGLLVGLGLVGAFCWPVCAPACALLLLFPRQRQLNAVPWSRPAMVLCGIGAAVVVGAGLVARLGFGITQLTYATTPINDTLLPLSALIQAVLLALAATHLLGRLRPGRVLASVRAVPPARWAWALAVLVVPKIIILLIKKNMPPMLSMKLYLGVLSFAPLVRPALTPVGHFAYYGFVVPLLAFNWRRIGDMADRAGLGLIGFLALGLLVALPPEARQSLLSFPAIVVLLCCVAGHGWTGRQVLGLGVLQFLLARPWLDQNAAARPDLMPPLDLPAYFASQGTFMSDKAYAIFLVFLIVATGICYLHRRTVMTRSGSPV